MDIKFSIRQFPSPEHPYIAFPQKKLPVLDIFRFTFCKVDQFKNYIIHLLDQSIIISIITIIIWL